MMTVTSERDLMVRPAECADDLVRVARLGVRYHEHMDRLDEFDAGYCLELWDRLLREGVGNVWLAVRDGEVIGALAGMLFQHPMHGRLMANEGFWFVDPAVRGGTAGVRLFKAFEDWARAAGAKGIYAGRNLAESPDGLERFYERRGYRPRLMTYEKGLSDG